MRSSGMSGGSSISRAVRIRRQDSTLPFFEVVVFEVVGVVPVGDLPGGRQPYISMRRDVVESPAERFRVHWHTHVVGVRWQRKDLAACRGLFIEDIERIADGVCILVARMLVVAQVRGI